MCRRALLNLCKILLFALGLKAGLGLAAGDGFYLGMMLGGTNTNNEPATVYNTYTATDGTTQCNNNINGVPQCQQDNVDPSNTGLGGRLYLGVNISKYAGVEFGYTHFANSEYNADQIDKNPQKQENGVDLLVKAMYPIESFGVFGKVGLAYIRTAEGGSLTPPPSYSSQKSQANDNHVAPAVALGVFYDFTPNWEVDLSVNRYLQGSNGFQNADLVAIGVSYHIVTLYCGQFIC